MGIRNKILLYFSLTTISLTGIAFFFIYTLFAEYREEKFQQRQKEKIKSTLFFLSEIKSTNHELTEAIDRLTINDLYNEKLLIFDHNKHLIYSSIDDTPIPYSKTILESLSPQSEWHESKDELYDVVGLYFQNEGKSYYGISKAYDKFGYSKINYLRLVLIVAFLIISIAVVSISYFLARKITNSLIVVTKKMNDYNFDAGYSPIQIDNAENEISILAEQFNKLMKKMSEVFAFQKHLVHHISHELKTPIAILVSNFEKIEKETEIEKIQTLLQHQKEDTRHLGEIINALLEIAKAETGNIIKQDIVRIDELIFDIADELRIVYPDFLFVIEYIAPADENKLIIACNASLLKKALSNLMLNCIHHSSTDKANVKIEAVAEDNICITFENTGGIIAENEIQFLFQHFFRGQNSKDKKGFGLGLVFVYKIISLHGGHISYRSPDNKTNVFTLKLPLS